MATSRHTVEMPITAKDMTRAAFDSAQKRVQSLDHQMQRMNKTAVAANSGFRGMRGSLGQLGYQVQDVAVQLQAGQNAMLVFGQQGSQIASVFGPGGIVVGALLAVGAAVGTALAPSLFKATDQAKELEEALEAVAAIATITDENTLQLSESVGKLAQKSGEAAAVMLKVAAIEAQSALEAAVSGLGARLDEEIGGFLGPNVESAMASARKAIEDGIDIDKIMGRGINAAASRRLRRSFGPLRGAVSELTDEFGISEQAALSLLAAMDAAKVDPTKENLDSLLDTVVSITPATGEMGASFRLLQADLIRTQQSAAEAEQTLRMLEEAVKANAETGALPPVGGVGGGDGEQSGESEKQIEGLLELETEMNKIWARIYKRRAESKKQADDQTATSELNLVDRMAAINLTGNKKINAVFQAAKIAQATMAGYAAMQEALALPPPSNIAAMAMVAVETAANIAGIKAASFAGGGYTGNGPRAGGIDGKGGFMAIMHPRETVIDHAQGQSMGGNILMNVYANDAKSFEDQMARSRGAMHRMLRREQRKRGKRF